MNRGRDGTNAEPCSLLGGVCFCGRVLSWRSPFGKAQPCSTVWISPRRRANPNQSLCCLRFGVGVAPGGMMTLCWKTRRRVALGQLSPLPGPPPAACRTGSHSGRAAQVHTVGMRLTDVELPKCGAFKPQLSWPGVGGGRKKDAESSSAVSLSFLLHRQPIPGTRHLLWRCSDAFCPP